MCRVGAGLVCTGGTKVTGWDPRLNGNPNTLTSAFHKDYADLTNGNSHCVQTMLSVGEHFRNLPHLLTGVGRKHFPSSVKQNVPGQ
jgi:hypothetical protein